MNNKKLQTKKYVKKHINELSHNCKINRIRKYMRDIITIENKNNFLYDIYHVELESDDAQGNNRFVYTLKITGTVI